MMSSSMTPGQNNWNDINITVRSASAVLYFEQLEIKLE